MATVAQLRSDLAAAGIDAPAGARKADLEALAAAIPERPDIAARTPAGAVVVVAHPDRSVTIDGYSPIDAATADAIDGLDGIAVERRR